MPNRHLRICHSCCNYTLIQKLLLKSFKPFITSQFPLSIGVICDIDKRTAPQEVVGKLFVDLAVCHLSFVWVKI